jgi:GntR family transcriptional regulator
MAKDYGLSPQTIQNAVRELRNEELVVSQQGRAFFVRDPDRPVASEGLAERVEAVEAELRELRTRLESIELNS